MSLSLVKHVHILMMQMNIMKFGFSYLFILNNFHAEFEAANLLL